jgi:hypothetical protein
MNDDYKQHAQALIQRLLAEAHEGARANSYKDALVALRKAKALDTTNIYILAFERQVEQLEELTAGGTITDDQRNDILESIPGLIEQAHATQAPLATPGSADAERHVSPEQQEHMRAARQWLKNQYFQRAHDHVRKHEYDEARAELRRVFVIDDSDLFAVQFEAKILQLQDLHRKEATPASGRSESEGESPHLLLDAEASTKPEGERTAESAAEAESDATPADSVRKTHRLLTIALIIAVAVVAFAFGYFWKREQPEQIVLPPTVDETEQPAADDEPVYPIPSSIPADSAAQDSVHTP